MKNDDFDVIYDTIFSERMDLVNDRLGSNISWFRKHYDKLQSLVDIYKRNPQIGRKLGDTAYALIAKLALADGVVGMDGCVLSKEQIAVYMGTVRSEKKGTTSMKKKAVSVPTDTGAAARFKITGKVSAPAAPTPPANDDVNPSDGYVPPSPIKELAPESIDRLYKEYQSHFRGSEWTGQDEYYLASLMETFEEEKTFQTKRMTLWDAAHKLTWPIDSMERSVDHLQSKLKRLGLFDHYKDLKISD